MKHLTVGIAAASILIISIYYNVIEINLNLLLINIGNIVVWMARLMLGAIIASKLKK